METIQLESPINLKVVRFELDFTPPKSEPAQPKRARRLLRLPQTPSLPKVFKKPIVPPPPLLNVSESRDVKELIEDLLHELYADREWASVDQADSKRSSAASWCSSSVSCGREQCDAIERHYLEGKDESELRAICNEYEISLQKEGSRLARHVQTRDRLRRQQSRLNAVLSVLLRHTNSVNSEQMSSILNSLKNLAISKASSGGDSNARFSVRPGASEGGYGQWLHAMRLVARLPTGIPHHFRKKLWLTLSEKYLDERNVDWPLAERSCFWGTAHPEDSELGAQIVKDLHRTGCSLFCGTEGRENQAMLRRVLLAYARWNKEVGYCQGFNMLAAIILEVMEKSESDSLKVMIYLVEAVLPDGYFADDLRGLSADMGAFRDLLRLRMPRLAQHMDKLQKASDGGGVEPPLPDVFTMQWFLTLYATWLPREALLRVWDLIMLDGNELLLLTALAIWEHLQDRILSTRSADEFYSCMGNGAGYIWESGDVIVARLIALGGAPELPRLRNIHRYQVSPPIPPAAPVALTTPSTVQSVTRKGLKLFYSEDEGDSSDADEGNKMALATVNPSIRRDSAGDRLSLDIGALKRQYARLRERQRQAHIILAAACARHATIGVPTTPTSLTVNNLLLGKSAIVSSRGRIGPPPGAIPPSRNQKHYESRNEPSDSRTINWNDENRKKSLVRRDSIKWKDIKKLTEVENETRKSSLDSDEAGDGVIVSEKEAKEMMSAMRTRSISESSSYSSHSDSSSDTSLCDDNPSDNDSDHSDTRNLQNDGINRISPVMAVSVTSNLSRLENNNEKNKKQKCDKDNYESIELGFDNNQSSEKAMLQSNFHSICSNVPTTSTDKLSSSLPEIEPYANSESSMSEANANICNPSSLNLEEVGSVFEHLQSALTTMECVEKPQCSSQSYEKTDSSHDYTNQLSKVRISPITEIVKDKKVNMEILRDISNSSFTKTTQSYKEYLQEFEKCSVSNPATVRSTYRISPLLTPETCTRNAWEYSTKNDASYLIHQDSRTETNTLIKNAEDSDKNTINLSPIKFSPIDQQIKIWDDQLNFGKYAENDGLAYSIKRPDIIDSLVTSPNFIPDIELSDKNVFDLEKCCQSPGNESICISEDEPIIPLKIDKYFEHSPEFFGARKCDPNDADIPNRRAPKRYARYPKKPDSLNLQSDYNQKYLEQKVDIERAASFPQGRFQNSRSKECWDHGFKSDLVTQNPDLIKNHLQNDIAIGSKNDETETTSTFELLETFSRRNSERALQIIQENSKILSRILTKQIVKDEPKKILSPCPEKDASASDLETRKDDLSLSQSCKSDSLCTKEFKTTHLKSTESTEKQQNNSIFSYDSDPNIIETGTKDINIKNKIDTPGWENKVFKMKEDSSNNIVHLEKSRPKSFHGDKLFSIDTLEDFHGLKMIKSPSSFHCQSIENKESCDLSTIPLKNKQESTLLSSSKRELTYESDDKPIRVYNTGFATEKSSSLDFRLTDVSCKNLSQRVYETVSKDSQSTDFAKIVTSSVSFSYDPSCEVNSPIGLKSDSSDTLCQIASLDQISTPISPKCLVNIGTPTCLEGLEEKCDKHLPETDDTCSPITSLLDTDTFSSLSCPKSPSSSSYHPFPTRPNRTPRDLGIRLGMYSKDSINSPSK